MTKPFDNYEISPCRRNEETPGHFYFEVCEPHEADVWTLYGHTTGEGATAIADFDTREDAADIFARITGVPFTGNHSATCRVRLSLTAPQMFEALLQLVDVFGPGVEAFGDGAGIGEIDAIKNARDAINLVTKE